MTLASRLSGGLAWAGLVLVIGVPAADMLWPNGAADKELLAASPAREKASTSPEAAAATPKPVTPVAAVAEPRPAKPVAAPRAVNRGASGVAEASGSLASVEPAQAEPAVATASAPVAGTADTKSRTAKADGPVVETTADSVTIIPRAAARTARAAIPVPEKTDAAPAAPSEAPTPAREKVAATATTAASAPDAVADGSAVEVGKATDQVASAAPAPLVAPIPAPLSQRPPSRPAAQTQTASISVHSRHDYVSPPAAYSPSPSIIVVDPPADVRPLPDAPDAPIVTEDELRGWKSGTLAQYLASKGLLHRGARQAPDRVETRPNGYVDKVPSDGQYYDEGDPGYPYAN